jgi:hypothetical protein
MKKIIYTLLLSIYLISSSAFVNFDKNKEAVKSAALKKWEATPEGIFFKKWEASAVGKKVIESTSKIRKSINDFANMEAVVTSLSLPTGARLGFGMMVNINGEDYILSFGPDLNKEFGQLRNLKVNDKIIIKSHSVSKAPKYAYPIISGDYIESDGKIIYKRAPNKGGC